MIRPLITGAESFIGSHLVDALCRRGIKPRLFVLNNTDLSNLRGKYNDLIVQGDLRTGEGLREAVKGVDILFHLASVTRGYTRHHFVSGNLRMSNNIIKQLRGLPSFKRVVLLSSMATVGPVSLLKDGEFIDEEYTYEPMLHYGVGKKSIEDFLKNSAEEIPYTIIRSPTVFGPRDLKLLWYFRGVSRGVRGLPGSGRQQFSITYVKDLVEALIMAAESSNTVNRTYYIASEEVTTWKIVSEIIAKAFGRKTIELHVPIYYIRIFFALIELSARLGAPPSELNINKSKAINVKRFVCSCERARAEFGFKSRYTLFEAVRETIQWYKSHEYIKNGGQCLPG
jgi:nucleoside-diphosphate-sugar epimerase